MKNLTNNIFQIIAATLLAFSVSNCGDDEPVVPPNEEELITTVNLTFTPSMGSAVTMKFYDSDGEDGPANPVITGGSLKSNTEYSVSLELLNESETPSEDVTEEIEEEDEDHQFFFQASAALNLTHSYDDQDGNGNPVGLKNKITTGGSSSGTLTLTLRHEPNKSASGVSDGDITNAAGETDIEVTFDVIVED